MARNLFNSVVQTRPNKNVFDLTHDVKLSGNMGNLYPVCLLECVPGDHFTLGCETLVRFAPLVAPVMHRFNVTTHYFFVPNRIMWDHWENWITDDPQDAANTFPVVVMDNTNALEGTLADYLGIPPTSTLTYVDDETVSAMPFAAYQMVYNEYYRDQNLITELYNPQEHILVDGDNTANANLFALRIRAWEHDYFTSALPFAQKGGAVTIPGTTFEDVPVSINQTGPPAAVQFNSDVPLGTAMVMDLDPTAALGVGVNYAYAETSTLSAAAANINELRRAFRLQEYLEKNARGGTRYIEHILMHFGVRSSDKRLNRPEYITGVKSPVIISEVLNTSGEVADGGLPQGNMAGHGVGVVSGKYGKYFCEEHGYIIGIMSVLPRTAYQQGIDKHWFKVIDPTQFYYPSFAHIGEQEIINSEVYAFQFHGTTASDNKGTFGYVPRYAEYKFMNSRVAGEFRDSLDYWHDGRIFNAQPALSQQFIQCVPSHRIFAVESVDEDKLFIHHLNKIKAVRPMPKFGTPSF